MPYSPMGTQPFGIAPLWPFGAYPWQALLHPSDAYQPMPGISRVAAPSTALSRDRFLLFHQWSSTIPTTWWGIQLWGLGRVTQSHCLPYMLWRGLLFQVWFHQMTQLTLNLWLVLNLAVPVWWLGIRLMSSLVPHLQSSLLLNATFILVSWVRWHHLLTFHLNQGKIIIHF